MKCISGSTNQQPGMAVCALAMLTVLILTAGALPLQGQNGAAEKQTPAVTHNTVSHNTWTSGAAMPTAVWHPGGTGVVKDEIYVVGGMDSDNTIIANTQIYNPASNSWSTGVPLPTALVGGVGAVVKNILYVIGGSTDGTTETNAVWAFNSKTKTWSAKTAIPTARVDAGVTVEKNIIYVVGGASSGIAQLSSVESYNPATNTWAEEAPLLNGKSQPSVGLVGKTIVAADGYTGAGDVGDNEGYSATTNSWEIFTADPMPRNAACGAGIGTLMYVAGGYSAGAASVTESFQLSKNEWTTLESMPQATLYAGSAVYDKQLYCIGGTSNLQAPLSNVQIYQP